MKKLFLITLLVGLIGCAKEKIPEEISLIGTWEIREMEVSFCQKKNSKWRNNEVTGSGLILIELNHNRIDFLEAIPEVRLKQKKQPIILEGTLFDVLK
jgi:hypothetical protein